MERNRSAELFVRASKSIVGGVNSPARAFKSVGGEPLFIDKAKGCRIWDADGNEYIDFIGSWGPMIAGHCHPKVTEAVEKYLSKGASFGVSTEIEILLAEKVRAMMPSMELLRMVNSGTEATMSAIRAARGYTGRSMILKFAGCYHGHGDSFLIKAGSGALTHGVPTSGGVTPSVAGDTLIAEYNDLGQVGDTFKKLGGNIAAVIVEPVVGNMGTVIPEEGFLQGLRKICDDYGCVLIFDEVMTGFRLASGGAQALYNVKPDMTTLGKIIGGGLPVGAYGGKKDIMEKISPLGPVYQAGTLSGNPLAMAAGLALLNIIDNTETYEILERSSEKLCKGIYEAAKKAGKKIVLNRVGSMFTVFFTDKPVNNYSDALRSDTDIFARFFRGMLDLGVLLPPSQFEASFVSLAHDGKTIDETVYAASEVFGKI